MTSTAREWGIALFRLWIGLLLLFTSFQEFRHQLTAAYSVGIIGSKFASYFALATFAAWTIQFLGGAAVFLGLATRSASIFAALSIGFIYWADDKINILNILSHPVPATLFISCLALFLTGPGRLNLGTFLRKKKIGF